MTRMAKIQTSSCTWTTGSGDGQQDEGDQRDAGDAVGFETVGRGSDGIAGVVARAIGDDAGVAGVVFLDLEDDLHQVGADVGDLGEDAAGHAQRRGAQRFADGEADEAGPGQIARNEEQDEEHDQQFDGDQQHADAHAGLQRNVVAGDRACRARLAKAVRELAKVLTRMPKAATQKLPEMPITLNSRMISDLDRPPIAAGSRSRTR